MDIPLQTALFSTINACNFLRHGSFRVIPTKTGIQKLLKNILCDLCALCGKKEIGSYEIQ